MKLETFPMVSGVSWGGRRRILPVCRMLVQLIKLPVHRIHIHVVVFLKVPQEKLDGMVSSQEPLFIQVNFLDLRLRRQKVVRVPGKCLRIVTCYILLEG